MNKEQVFLTSILTFLERENPHLHEHLVGPLINQTESQTERDWANHQAWQDGVRILFEFIAALKFMPRVNEHIATSTISIAQAQPTEFVWRENRAIQRDPDAIVAEWRGHLAKAEIKMEAYASLKRTPLVSAQIRLTLFIVFSCLRQARQKQTKNT